MKYCHDYAASLDLFVDGELNAAEMADVQAHLDTCPGCRAYVDDALAMRAAFPDAEEMEVPAGFAEGVMAAISASAPAKKPVRKHFWLKTLMPLAACLAVVIVLQNGPAAKSNSPNTASASAATTESAVEAPAAMQESKAARYALDTTAETESAKIEPAPAAGMAYQDNAPAETAAEESKSQEQEETSTEFAVIHAARLELPAEAARFLEGFSPVEETDTEIHYHLSAEECSTLQGQLGHAQIAYTEEAGIEPNTEEILVILKK